jgi:hypothetical protein
LKKGNFLLVSMLLAGTMGILCGNGFAELQSGFSPVRPSKIQAPRPATLSPFQNMTSARRPQPLKSEFGARDVSGEAKRERPEDDMVRDREWDRDLDWDQDPDQDRAQDQGRDRDREKPVEAREELSQLEKMIFREERAAQKSMSQPYQRRELLQFGYNYFKPATEFAPLTDIPVGSDYIIGPGDKFILNLWGSVEGTY